MIQIAGCIAISAGMIVGPTWAQGICVAIALACVLMDKGAQR